jgi:hypothetical protein
MDSPEDYGSVASSSRSSLESLELDAVLPPARTGEDEDDAQRWSSRRGARAGKWVGLFLLVATLGIAAQHRPRTGSLGASGADGAALTSQKRPPHSPSAGGAGGRGETGDGVAPPKNAAAATPSAPSSTTVSAATAAVSAVLGPASGAPAGPPKARTTSSHATRASTDDDADVPPGAKPEAGAAATASQPTRSSHPHIVYFLIDDQVCGDSRRIAAARASRRVRFSRDAGARARRGRRARSPHARHAAGE